VRGCAKSGAITFIETKIIFRAVKKKETPKIPFESRFDDDARREKKNFIVFFLIG